MPVIPTDGSIMNKIGLKLSIILKIVCSKYSVKCLREYASKALDTPTINEASISLKRPCCFILFRSKFMVTFIYCYKYDSKCSRVKQLYEFTTLMNEYITNLMNGKLIHTIE